VKKKYLQEITKILVTVAVVNTIAAGEKGGATNGE
jgi:hypothetical protein